MDEQESSRPYVSPKDYVELIEDEEVKESTRPVLESRPDEELKKIAKEIHQGLIFPSFGLTLDQVKFTFMVLLFVEELPKNLGSVYEYYSEASPRSINGLPNFFSCQLLNVDDTKKVIEYLKKIEEAMKAI